MKRIARKRSSGQSAWHSKCRKSASDEEADRLLKNVEQKIDDRITEEPSVSVEEIQDLWNRR